MTYTLEIDGSEQTQTQAPSKPRLEATAEAGYPLGAGSGSSGAQWGDSKSGIYVPSALRFGLGA